MDDDFNTAQAIATLFNLAQEINRAVNLGNENKVIEHRKIFQELAGVLGLILPEPEEQISGRVDQDEIDKKEIAKTRGEKLDQLLDTIESIVKGPNKDIETVRGYVNLALGVRNSLRQDGKYELADKIRDRLNGCGFTMNDIGTVTEWKYKI